MKKGKSFAYVSLATLLGISIVASGVNPPIIYADKTEDENKQPGEELDKWFEGYLDEQGFPESYKPMLRELHKKYPDWIFEAFHTGLDWNTVLDEEMYQARNLIPNKGYATSFFDTENSWSYNWLKNEWNVLSAPYWIQVSREGLAYFLDPRNWLSEEHIFEFEKLSYNENVQTLAGVEQILKGTFMENAYVDGVKENPYFDSSFLSTTDTYITGVTPGMNVKQIIAEVDLFDDQRYVAEITNLDGNAKDSSALVGTGDRVCIFELVPYEVEIKPDEVEINPDEDEENPDSDADLDINDNEEKPKTEIVYRQELRDSYPIVVFGDVNGDGVVDNLDRASLKGYVKGKISLTGVKLKAADANQDGVVDALDRALLKAFVGNKGNIKQALKTNINTYAEVFYKIGQEIGVSPISLAYRVRIEQGVSGSSKLIAGNVPGYEGYYNYFNIGAYGVTMDDIITNGLNEAVSEGWTSQYLAIEGGAKKLASGHIWKGQDTLYLQKFDVEGEYYGYFWHQYMQNVTSPYSEGNSSYRAYREIGALSNAFTFKIPVYLNMPETASPEPTVTGNPNTRLNALEVEGYTLTPTFTYNTFNYKVTVPLDVTTLEVNAEAIASTTQIAGDGTIKITPETTELVIKTTAENGDEIVYTISLKRT